MRISLSPLNILLTLLFVFAPLYYHDNLGGRGLELTFNIPVWIIASYVIGYALILITSKQRIILPTNAWAYLVFPVIIIVSGLLSGSSQPIAWLFIQIYVFSGVFFLFSLFQFKSQTRHIEYALYTLAAAALLNAIIATVQIVSPNLLYGWAPFQGNPPIGVFQQVNVLASFLSTGLAISLYLITRPSIRTTPAILKAFLILNVGMCAFIIVYTGSRIGLLSGILSISLLGFSRWRLFKKQTILTLLATIAIAGGAIKGGDGFERVTSKTQEITQGTSASARINMYAIALELIAEKPLTGHGIGNFLRVWGEQNSNYLQRNPDAVLPPYVTHPHNEFILWLIEGGITSFAAILIALGAILVAIFRCGWQRGGAYTALLVPISLHTQVELPFYISSVHWFAWLLLVFLILRHQTVPRTTALSSAATQLIRGVALLGCLGVSYFMVHCARAQADIHSYVQAEKTTGPYLQIALHNLYFKPYAEQLAMRAMLQEGMLNNDPVKARRFAAWAEEKITSNPTPEIVVDLINAYNFLQEDEARCRATRTGALIYPLSQPLAEAVEKFCGQ